MQFYYRLSLVRQNDQIHRHSEIKSKCSFSFLFIYLSKPHASFQVSVSKLAFPSTLVQLITKCVVYGTLGDAWQRAGCFYGPVSLISNC